MSDAIASFGVLVVRPFGLALALGLLVSFYATERLATRCGIAPRAVAWAYAVGMVVAAVTHFGALRVPVLAGFAGSHAGPLVAGLVGVGSFALALRRSGARALDLAASGAVVVFAFARVGCHLAGCLPARHLGTDAPRFLRALGAVRRVVRDEAIVGSDTFLVQLRAGLVAPTASRGLPAHPLALYEVGVASLALAFALVSLRRPGRVPIAAFAVLLGGLVVAWLERALALG